MFSDVLAPHTPGTGDRGVLTGNADVQNLLGAHQNEIFRRIGHAMETQAVRFLEIQRGLRARDAPARMPHAPDDAMEVMGYEDRDLCEGLVHLDPQDVFVNGGTSLCDTLNKNKNNR